MQTSLIKRVWQQIQEPLDGWLMLFLGMIFVVSMVLLYSANNQSFDKIDNKLIYTSLSLIIMWIIARMRPQSIMNFAPPIYGLGVLLLLAVHFKGVTVNGSTRWLELGITRIQPSEIMKIALPMMLAWFFQKYELSMRWWHYLVAALLMAVPSALVLKQPDLGTTLLIAAAGLFVLFFAGLPWKVIFAGIGLGAASLPIVWNLLHDYQRRRVLTMIDPTTDPLGDGYHIIQSMIAIGSGGPWGKGWLNGTQTHLDYIPERTTDFIFAVYSEEFGLAGNVLLLVLYLLVLSRAMMITASAQTLYGRLMAGSITMSFFVYAFVNMGMVSGILPVVGVPLPFMSYGGTATVTLFVGMGMLMSISNLKR
ncbi:MULTISPECIES: rod shape-determining protein RodA [Chromobacterium]|uniref:Peptidoglycan glycosyltransferase MrdB n=1 Tax=Chromobacterium haemolyticum TaxID=394935 RepID=A0A1W0D358_9NEIS|nr:MULTISPECIES: rod shape-determining protein RodA [Chromobacterium]OQS41424.1 rod shape-determining protein RodA [Chromobacterium haemolyticum]QOZ85638.1 rod shape-determining protein RodA [Chromobacterium sp. Rain0013]WON81815.1 rod shape-determining protein RodA [Chromobacterium haemolyticum]